MAADGALTTSTTAVPSATSLEVRTAPPITMAGVALGAVQVGVELEVIDKAETTEGAMVVVVGERRH